MQPPTLTAQSIYSFRGADINNILTFETMFDSVKTIRLNMNYRSTQPILDASCDVINAAEDLYSKELLAARDGGEKPKFVETLSGLQQDGKLIGIISHVSALKERIGTQINITPVSGGRSSLWGPGCTKVVICQVPSCTGGWRLSGGGAG